MYESFTNLQGQADSPDILATQKALITQLASFNVTGETTETHRNVHQPCLIQNLTDRFPSVELAVF